MTYFKDVLDNQKNSVRLARMKNNKHFVDDNQTFPFTVADMSFKAMPEIKEAINEYLEENTLCYTFPRDSYYDVLSNFMKEVHNLEVDRKEVLTFTGVLPMIDTIIKSYTNEKDGIVIFTPVYPPFYSTVKNANRTLVECPLNNEDGFYTIDFELFDSLTQDENVKMVLFCSPHNPVSRVWTKEELEKLVEISRKNNLLIISDEIHADITLYDNTHNPLATLAPEITYTCTSPSKTFNLASSNCANLIVKNPKLYGRIVDYNTKQPHNWVNALGLVATETVYSNYKQWMVELKELLEKNYEYIKERLGHKVTITPLEGTYLLWVDLNPYIKENIEERLHQHNIYVNNGEMFGDNGKGFIRINIACPLEYLEVLCDRLLKVIED